MSEFTTKLTAEIDDCLLCVLDCCEEFEQYDRHRPDYKEPELLFNLFIVFEGGFYLFKRDVSGSYAMTALIEWNYGLKDHDGTSIAILPNYVPIPAGCIEIDQNYLDSIPNIFDDSFNEFVKQNPGALKTKM
jgi:hypothetical protein